MLSLVGFYALGVGNVSVAGVDSSGEEGVGYFAYFVISQIHYNLHMLRCYQVSLNSGDMIFVV
jgi:hypothetical protein